MLTVRADVDTDNPARYAKQLLSHLGRRLEFTTDGDTSTFATGEAGGSITVGDRTLILQVHATDEQVLERLKGALGGHLERFGARDELVVSWVGA